jgi:hypothetical protein
LLQDLILSRLFVDRNLICGGSKLGAVIAKLCGLTLLMD